MSHLNLKRFTEKQGKILRDIRKKLVARPSEDAEPVPVTKARLLFQSCLDSSAIDKLQFDPLFRYLKDYKLPKVPSLIIDPTARDVQFDWIKSIVKIKRSLGADKLIGFEIFPDPKNRTQQYLAIGSPSQENDLPLWVRFNYVCHWNSNLRGTRIALLFYHQESKILWRNVSSGSEGNGPKRGRKKTTRVKSTWAKQK